VGGVDLCEAAKKCEDAAFKQLVAVGQVVDDLGIGNKEAAIFYGSLFGDGGFEKPPETWKIFEIEGEGNLRQMECGGRDHKGTEQRAVAGFINTSEDHEDS
jgi:hypothetical protein